MGGAGSEIDESGTCSSTAWRNNRLGGYSSDGAAFACQFAVNGRAQSRELALLPRVGHGALKVRVVAGAMQPRTRHAHDRRYSASNRRPPSSSRAY